MIASVVGIVATLVIVAINLEVIADVTHDVLDSDLTVCSGGDAKAAGRTDSKAAAYVEVVGNFVVVSAAAFVVAARFVVVVVVEFAAVGDASPFVEKLQ